MRRILVLLAVLGLLATACGSGGAGIQVDDGRGVLAAALSRAETAGTARLATTVTMEIGGDLGGTLEMSGQGVMSLDPSRLDLAVTTSFSGSDASVADQRMRIRFVDGDLYLRYSDQLARQAGLPDGVTWVRQTMETMGAGSGFLPGLDDAQDPTTMLESLRLVSDDVREVGNEQVRGTTTTVYEASVNPRRAMDRLRSEQPGAGITDEGLEDSLALVGETFPVTVWIDGDGLPRRVRTEIEHDGTETTAPTEAGASAGADVAFRQVMTFEMFDWGLDVEIEAPPAAETIDMDALRDRASGSGPVESGTESATASATEPDEIPIPDLEYSDEGVYRLDPEGHEAATPEAEPTPTPSPSPAP